MICYELMGAESLEEVLRAKSQTDFEKVRNKNLLQMRDRAVRGSNPTQGGTPRDTGELRLSAMTDTNRGLFGYTKDYAPHVNHGYRVVIGGRTVGYVGGQNFLGANLNIQKPIYKDDLVNEMRKS